MSYSRDKKCSEHSRTVGASRNSCYLFLLFLTFLVGFFNRLLSTQGLCTLLQHQHHSRCSHTNWLFTYGDKLQLEQTSSNFPLSRYFIVIQPIFFWGGGVSFSLLPVPSFIIHTIAHIKQYAGPLLTVSHSTRVLVHRKQYYHPISEHTKPL